MQNNLKGAEMKFDIIIPVGSFCAGAQALRSVKKRSRSLPLDWVGPVSLTLAVDFLETGFKSFFEKEDLKKYEKDTKKNIGYINTRTNVLFMHDFKDISRFDEEYVLIREKYDRRIKRLYQTINDSKDILYLHVFQAKDQQILLTDEEIVGTFERLQKMNPGKNHRLLFINLAETEEDKGGFDHRKIREDIDYYNCYRDKTAQFEDGVPSYIYFQKNVETVLKLYKVRKSVRDALKKFGFKLLDALSSVVPSRSVREKLRMMYKEYK